MKFILSQIFFFLFAVKAFALYAPNGSPVFDITCQNANIQADIQLPKGQSEFAIIQMTDLTNETVSTTHQAQTLVKSGTQILNAESFRIFLTNEKDVIVAVYAQNGNNQRLSCQTVYHIMNSNLE